MTKPRLNAGTIFSLSLAITITVMLPARLTLASSIAQKVSRIDQAVELGLKQNRLTRNPPANDMIFLRRIYLDTIGRIPNLAEIRSFKQGQSRSELIKELIARPTYTSHQFNYWTSLLRVHPKLRPDHQNYLNYIKDSLRANKSYQDFVYEMLAAEGNAYALGNGATGYYNRDFGMRLDNLSLTSQVFLGLDISCAQCHDDPFSDWTQMDFYQLSAYSMGMDHFGISAKLRNELRAEAKKRKLPVANQKAIYEMVELMRYVIKGSGKGFAVMPYDYKYDDARPLAYVQARVLYGKQPHINLDLSQFKKAQRTPRGRYKTPGEAIGARMRFAQWLTADDNDMFVKAIVNRMWHKTMGTTLVGPLTDLEMEAMGVNPQLTSELMRIMREIKFDLRAFEEILFRTRTYQSEVSKRDLASGAAYHFSGPVIRRLSHTQLWDSLMVLKNEQFDQDFKLQSRLTSTIKVYERIKDWKKKDFQQYMKNMPEFELSRGSQLRSVVKDLESKIQVLATPKKNKRTKKKRPSTGTKLHAGQARTSNSQAVDLRHYVDISLHSQKKKKAFIRASDLEAPSKPAHFLRQFGQSDRQLIDADSLESHIPQILFMMNGQTEAIASIQRHSIVKHVKKAKGNKTKLETAYLMILCRKPTEQEVTLFESKLKINGYEWRDVIWTLLNTNEFKFKR